MDTSISTAELTEPRLRLLDDRGGTAPQRATGTDTGALSLPV